LGTLQLACKNQGQQVDFEKVGGLFNNFTMRRGIGLSQPHDRERTAEIRSRGRARRRGRGRALTSEPGRSATKGIRADRPGLAAGARVRECNTQKCNKENRDNLNSLWSLLIIACDQH
jgi:hypothetical protein